MSTSKTVQLPSARPTAGSDFRRGTYYADAAILLGLFAAQAWTTGAAPFAAIAALAGSGMASGAVYCIRRGLATRRIARIKMRSLKQINRGLRRGWTLSVPAVEVDENNTGTVDERVAPEGPDAPLHLLITNPADRRFLVRVCHQQKVALARGAFGFGAQRLRVSGDTKVGATAIKDARLLALRHGAVPVLWFPEETGRPIIVEKDIAIVFGKARGVLTMIGARGKGLL